MGDRVSISFVHEKTEEESVVLFDHWGGMERVENAREYVDALVLERMGQEMMPLDRLEPGTVMVDYIRYIAQGRERIEGSWYLGATPDDGDNSNNGHHQIFLP